MINIKIIFMQLWEILQKTAWNRKKSGYLWIFFEVYKAIAHRFYIIKIYSDHKNNHEKKAFPAWNSLRIVFSGALTKKQADSKLIMRWKGKVSFSVLRSEPGTVWTGVGREEKEHPGADHRTDMIPVDWSGCGPLSAAMLLSGAEKRLLLAVIN